MAKSTSDHPFRDGEAGTEAKRSHLLRDRRDDLATMPHAIRRVFVARVARIFATGALAVTGLFLLLMLKFPSLSDGVADLIPGTMPAPAPTALLATWIIGGFFLLIGRSIAEFRFGVAMSKAVLPSDELYGDVDRLQNESPDNVARSMARRLDLLSRLMPVLAAACIIPATAIALYSMVNTDVAMVNELETRLLHFQTPLLGIAVLGALIAFFMAIRPTASLRGFALLSAVGTAVAFCFNSTGGFVVLFAGLCMSAWVGVRSLATHQRENIKIDQEGAPLPVVFNLRSACAQVRDSVKAKAARTKGFVVRNRRFFMATSALVLFTGIAAGSYLAASPASAPEAAQLATPDLAVPNVIPIAPNSHNEPIDQVHNPAIGSATRVQDAEGPVVAFQFVQGAEVDATAILRGATVPHGWAASVHVSIVTSEHPLFVNALAGEAPRQLTTSNPSVSFSTTNCGGTPQRLPLVVTPYGDVATYGDISSKTTKATLQYEVQLEMVNCRAVY